MVRQKWNVWNGFCLFSRFIQKDLFLNTLRTVPYGPILKVSAKKVHLGSCEKGQNSRTSRITGLEFKLSSKFLVWFRLSWNLYLLMTQKTVNYWVPHSSDIHVLFKILFRFLQNFIFLMLLKSPKFRFKFLIAKIFRKMEWTKLIRYQSQMGKRKF